MALNERCPVFTTGPVSIHVFSPESAGVKRNEFTEMESNTQVYPDW